MNDRIIIDAQPLQKLKHSSKSKMKTKRTWFKRLNLKFINYGERAKMVRKQWDFKVNLQVVFPKLLQRDDTYDFLTGRGYSCDTAAANLE